MEGYNHEKNRYRDTEIQKWKGKKTTKRNINQRLDGAHDNAHMKEIKIRG